MKAIKKTLTERWYAWEDARKIAERDPEIDLGADLESPAYRPKNLFQVRMFYLKMGIVLTKSSLQQAQRKRLRVQLVSKLVGVMQKCMGSSENIGQIWRSISVLRASRISCI